MCNSICILESRAEFNHLLIFLDVELKVMLIWIHLYVYKELERVD